MSAERPDLDEVRSAIRAQLETGPSLRVDDVAQRMYVSKSTLQRALRHHDTNFTRQRQRVRVEVAIARLIRGATCASAAGYVGLSRDHMCKLVTRHTGLTPRRIVRAQRLAQRARRWRRSGPPSPKSWLYNERLRQWRTIESELGKLTSEVPPGSPLAAWAQRLYRSAQRPDYRSRSARQLLAAERRREDAALLRSLERALAPKGARRSRAGGDHV